MSTPEQMKEHLNRFKHLWEEAESAREGFDWPDGRWKFQIAEGVVYMAQRSGEATAMFVLVCLGGDRHGQSYRKYFPLQKAWGIRQCREFLEGLGTKVPGHSNPGELVDIAEDLARRRVEFTVDMTTETSSNGRKFQNFQVVGEAMDGEKGLPEVGKGAEEKSEFSVGDRVSVKFDDEPYGGEIVYMNYDNAVAEVRFDDGDTGEVSFSELEEENRLLKDTIAFCRVYEIETTGTVEAMSGRIQDRAKLESWTEENFSQEEASLLGELGITLTKTEKAKRKPKKKKKSS